MDSAKSHFIFIEIPPNFSYFVLKKNKAKLLHTLTVKVDGFAGDSFEAVDFVTDGLSNVAVVFGLLNVVERRVDVAGADLTRDAADERVDVFAAVTFDAAVVVLVAGFTNGLENTNSNLLPKSNRNSVKCYFDTVPCTQWNSRSSSCAWRF